MSGFFRVGGVVAVCLVAACGNDSSPADMSADSSAPSFDLSTPDLAMAPSFAGVACGSGTCHGSDECCGDFSGGILSAMCVPAGGCDGGAPILCDGPEDCPGTSPPNGGCCVTIDGSGGNADAGTLSMGSGSSACGGTCPANAGNTNGSLFAQTKLCHAPADCNGYVGSVDIGTNPINGVKFDGCCSSSSTGPYRFCAPKAFASYANLSCM